MAEVNLPPEAVNDKVGAFREAFTKKYGDNITKGKYDRRDVDRLNTDDPYARCFLRTLKSKGNPEKAAEVADAAFKWRKEMGVWDMTEETFPGELTERNAIYYRGHDNKGHPILYINVKENNPPNKEGADWVKKYIAYHFEKHHRENPEQMCVVLMDMSGAGSGNVDIGTTKFIIQCFTTHFPAYLAYMVNYEMPTLLDVVWKAISAILNADQKKKLLMLKKKHIRDYIDEDNLWPHMR